MSIELYETLICEYVYIHVALSALGYFNDTFDDNQHRSLPQAETLSEGQGWIQDFPNGSFWIEVRVVFETGAGLMAQPSRNYIG